METSVRTGKQMKLFFWGILFFVITLVRCGMVSYASQISSVAHTIVCVKSDPANAGILSGGGEYQAGDPVVIKANTVSGYVFDGWYNDEVLLTKEAEYRFVIAETTPEELIYTAKYISNTAQKFSCNIGQGTVQYAYAGKNGTWMANVVNHKIPKGTYMTLEAVPFSGYEFLYWVNSDGRILSEKSAYSFYLGNDTALYAGYKASQEDQHYVVFKDLSGQVLWSGMVENEPGQTYGSVDIPTHESYWGFIFSGWYADDGTLLTAEESGTIPVDRDLVITAKYQKESGYTLTVADGSGYVENPQPAYENQQTVTVVAYESQEGKYFSGWYIGDVLVSYRQRYTTKVFGDTVLTAKYEGNQPVTEQPLISARVSTRVPQEDGTQKFLSVVEWDIPNGYTFSGAGHVRTLDDAKKNSLLLENVDGNVIYQTKTIKSASHGYMSMTVTLSSASVNKNVHFAGYLSYTNTETGESYTIYSPVASSMAEATGEASNGEYTGETLNASACSIDYAENAVTLRMNFSSDISGLDAVKPENLFLIEYDSAGNATGNRYPAALESGTLRASTSVTAAKDARSYVNNRYAAGVYSEADQTYRTISNLSFITNPENLPGQVGGTTSTYRGFYEAKTYTKRGMQGESLNIGDLNIDATLINIPINEMIETRQNLANLPDGEANPYVNYTYKGKTYRFHNMIKYQKTVFYMNGWLASAADNEIYKQYLDNANNNRARNVAVNLIMGWDPELTYLSAVNSPISGANDYAFNMDNAQARETLEALFCYMTERLGGPTDTRAFGGSSEDVKKYRVSSWILGNEVNACKAWNYYTGSHTAKECAQNYAKAFQLLYQAVRSADQKARVFISLDHTWNVDSFVFGHSAKEYLDEFAEYMHQTAPHMRWNVNFHPYSEPLNQNDFWNATNAADSVNTSHITMKNLDVLTNYLGTLENKYGMPTTNPDTDEPGYIRVILGEQGYSAIRQGVDQSATQAAAIAYEFYLASLNTRVDAFTNRAYQDDAAETAAGLYLGLMDQQGAHRASYDVYKILGTSDALSNAAVNSFAWYVNSAYSSWGSLISGVHGKTLNTDVFFRYPK